jgi:hypothetical protein
VRNYQEKSNSPIKSAKQIARATSKIRHQGNELYQQDQQGIEDTMDSFEGKY